jgi:hypothetical protein
MQFCFWGLPPLQRVFSNFLKNRQKNSVFGLGSPDLECLLLQAAKQQQDCQKLKKNKITVLSVL